MKLFQKKQHEKIIYREKPDQTLKDPVLLKEIEQVKLDMENAYTNFQNAVDPDLIDYYIFKSNAELKRYHFLLKQAKSN